MTLIELFLPWSGGGAPQGDALDQALDAISALLGCLRGNGQILGREHPVAQGCDGLRAYLMAPAPDSLDDGRDNQWVRKWKAHAAERGLALPILRILGSDPYSPEKCGCGKRSSLILYTTYLSLESCLRCGDCFDPVPLYEVPPTNEDSFDDALCWQSDYQACDTLQMNCSTGERFGTREISDANSSLSRRGREICCRIEAATQIPVFYFLYRYGGRGKTAERRRRCPGCGGEWLLQEQVHNLFDFKCEACRLLSQVSASA